MERQIWYDQPENFRNEQKISKWNPISNRISISDFCLPFTDGSVENEALENEDRSTKHPKTRKRSTRTRKRSTRTRKRTNERVYRLGICPVFSFQVLRFRVRVQKGQIPKRYTRSFVRFRVRVLRASVFVFECFVFDTTV